MEEMGNLSHDRCYGTDKSTQKSGYGELTRKIPPLEKGDEHPHPLPLPSGERMKVRGRTPCLLTQTPLYERGIDRTEKEIKQPSHMERDTPPPFPSPQWGEDEGEGENTLSANADTPL